MKVKQTVVRFWAAVLLLGATSSAFAGLPATGKCAFLMNMPNTAMFSTNWGPVSATTPANVVTDVLGEVDLQAKTINLTATLATWNGTGWTLTSFNDSGTYTETLPAVSGAPSLLTFSFTSGGTKKFNALTANSGNTILLQANGSKGTGVCQME